MMSKIDLISVGGSSLTRLQADENELVVVWVVEVDLISVWGIGMNLIFSVRAETHLVLV